MTGFFSKKALGLASTLVATSLAGSALALNPQPLPPGAHGSPPSSPRLTVSVPSGHDRVAYSPQWGGLRAPKSQK